MKRAFILVAILAAMVVGGSVHSAKACIGVCSSDNLQDLLRQSILYAQMVGPYYVGPIKGGDGATLLPGPTGGELVPGVLDPTGGSTVTKPDPIYGQPVSGDGEGNPDGIFVTDPDPDSGIPPRIGIIPGITPDGGTTIGGDPGGAIGPPDDLDTSHPYTVAVFNEQAGAAKLSWSTTGPNITLNPFSRLNSGDLAVLTLLSDNAPATSVTDTKGNLWRRAGVTASQGQGQLAIFVSKLNSDLVSGDRLTVSSVNAGPNSYWSWSLIDVVGEAIKFPVGVPGLGCAGIGYNYGCDGAGGGRWAQGQQGGFSYPIHTANPGSLVITAAFSKSSDIYVNKQSFVSEQGWLKIVDLPFAPEPYEGRRWLGVEAAILRGTQATAKPRFKLDRYGAAISVAFKIGYWG